jgi:hypothetical protein
MNHTHILRFLLMLLLTMGFYSVQAQQFILENPGKMFKKQERKVAPVLKTRYSFDVSPATGREYLKQQDLFDVKGKFKSSGVFADNGNKSGDIKYTYDATGKLLKQELKFIGKNEKEVTTFLADQKVDKIETFTKGDTLLKHTLFVYNEKGKLTEEQFFVSGKISRKKIYDDVWNDKDKLVQTCHYELDSLGNRIGPQAQLKVYEYDNQGMILQETVYNNKERRKMLSWIYYKYQLDNDYRIIKQSGFDEEQKEICRNELSYTDSSITSMYSKVCTSCPNKTMEKVGGIQLVFNSYGEKIRESELNAEGAITQTTTMKYDEFGNKTETLIIKTSEPDKLIKTKTILEFHNEQANTAKVNNTSKGK